MIIHAGLFYLFAAVAIAAAVAVITARNPVHSVLFLILTFFNAAGMFVLLGAEFLAMLLVIVYVGAVAVLFLFVVMMLDINFLSMRERISTYWPIGAVVGLILFLELAMVGGSSLMHGGEDLYRADPASPTPAIEEVTNTEAIGQVLYTDYIYLFQAAGMILLVAMIGAIMLTHRRRDGVRRQVIADQIARRKEETLEVKDVPSGGGLG